MEWTELLEKIPALYTIKVVAKDINSIKLLKSTLSTGERILNLPPDFQQNSQYVVKFVKQYSSQFRSQPVLQKLQKIKTAFTKISSNNCIDIFRNINASFPLLIGSGIDLELPTRQYFDYFLAKVLVHAKILTRLVLLAKEATMQFLHFLQRGHFMEISTLMVSLLSQVWHFSRMCLKQLAQFYDEIYKSRYLFPIDRNTKENNVLPETLELLIGQDWEEEIDITVNSSTSFSNVMFTVLDKEGNDEENSNRIKEKPNKIEEPQVKEEKTMETSIKSEPPMKKPKFELEDMGVPINRTIVQAHSVNNVNGKKSLEKFLSQENEFRNRKNPHSLTSSVSQFHWERFRRDLDKKLKKCNDLKSVFNQEWDLLIKDSQY